MDSSASKVLWIGWIAAAAVITSPGPGMAAEPLLYASIGEVTRPPVGWVEFCADRPLDCTVTKSSVRDRDVVMTAKGWKELGQLNRWVNDTIKPMTDLEHYGVLEKWAYPDDGYGDCEDYVLLKRRMLMAAGWPREALLITVVRDQKNDGHALLTVKTDRGEFILDNQNDAILLWSETSYRFIKRQSQSDPNVWVSLGDPRATAATATSR
jgi:predicted transglutaminase-like cysteine proteinase